MGLPHSAKRNRKENGPTVSPMSDYHNQVRGKKAIEYWIVKTRKRRSA